MNIVKAEILWSRKCHMKCPYCSMVTNEDNTPSVSQWIKGMDELKKLGCRFAAFYGAEPLLEFDKLPEVVGYAESIGIHTTIITSGGVTDFHKKLKELHYAGAKSLSMSYDTAIGASGVDSKAKSNRALVALKLFRDLGNIRDVAAICTLTSKNYGALPNMIAEMSKEGIWTFFDIIHPDRGQPGSKCKNSVETTDLLFNYLSAKDFIKFIVPAVLKMKDSGMLVHTSKRFLDHVARMNGQHLMSYDWNCAKDLLFPSWVTVNCDGSVYPCDDFQIVNPMAKSFKIWNIHERFDQFRKYWMPLVNKYCPGCCWNTHLDAHAIKGGGIPFKEYVHTKE